MWVEGRGVEGRGEGGWVEGRGEEGCMGRG